MFYTLYPKKLILLLWILFFFNVSVTGQHTKCGQNTWTHIQLIAQVQQRCPGLPCQLRCFPWRCGQFLLCQCQTVTKVRNTGCQFLRLCGCALTISSSQTSSDPHIKKVRLIPECPLVTYNSTYADGLREGFMLFAFDESSFPTERESWNLH